MILGFAFLSMSLGIIELSAVVVAFTGKLLNLLFYRLPGQYVNWIAVAVVPLGYAAHRFKSANQLYYGIIEVLVGLATALAATSRTRFGAVQALAVIGATYVVARGFNNVTDAGKKSTTSVQAASEHP